MVNTWNIIMHAYATHGKGREAVDTFHNMIHANIKPDAITFVALLLACSHSRLIEECKKFYNTMETVYGVKPNIQHQSCVLDCLARAGQLEEAEKFMSDAIVSPGILLSMFV